MIERITGDRILIPRRVIKIKSTAMNHSAEGYLISLARLVAGRSLVPSICHEVTNLETKSSEENENDWNQDDDRHQSDRTECT